MRKYNMRKYDVLNIIFESGENITPDEMSRQLNTSVSNIYVYLRELSADGLIKKGEGGKYTTNKTNEDLKQILNLRAMSPKHFHQLISPIFKVILEKFCEKKTVEQTEFSTAEIRRINSLLIPQRIVIRISKKPTIYILKLDEKLVTVLTGYHNLAPNFDVRDYQKVVGQVTITKKKTIDKILAGDLKVKEISEDAYRTGADIEIMKKSDRFSLDSRLHKLMDIVEQINKEHTLFLEALTEDLRKQIKLQWKKGYIYNTNSIEGNTMTHQNISDFFDGKNIKVASERELHETTNMGHALDFIEIKRNENITESLIQELHFMIQKDIDMDAGKYKIVYNCVGNNPTTPPKRVRERMGLLIDWYKRNEEKNHPVVLAAMFHMQFEMIHPFFDGNGRVGRLLMNHILQRNGYSPITILEKTKQDYYRALENKSIHQFLLYILLCYIKEYRR